jgi:pyridoxal phosphate enzyme (YggS family)
MNVAERIDAVRARIADAAARAGRDPNEVTLVAVTKTVEPERVREAIAAGVADLGENRAQEWRAKSEALSDLAVRWHFIGALQRNKVRDVAGRVALIHGVESASLARDVGARASAAPQDVLLEVNTSGEPGKHGVALAQADEAARAIAQTPGVRLRGYMTIAAPGDSEAARRSFGALRALRDRLAPELAGAVELSMGMSDDFEAAVAEGATIVRIGTAIFGERPAR